MVPILALVRIAPPAQPFQRIDPATGYPPGISIDPAPHWVGILRVAPGTRFPVYQALSTRNGGEVIDAGSY